MGGCRCTYKNCVSKSDGKTHLFHYPVFEKVRCHQWLVNAQKLSFLDLKVSQLRNRVVCQYHFNPDNFMNYKHDKLTFDAVPTVDGPFCDPSKFSKIEEPTEYPDLILLEDIENDFVVNDKKANYSIKYSDFLTNNEFLDSSSKYNSNNINLKKDCTDLNLNTSLPIANDKMMLESRPPKSCPMKKKKINSQPMLIVPPYSDLSNELKKGKEVHVEPDIINLTQSNLRIENQNTIAENLHVLPSLNISNSSIMTNESHIRKEPKVRILSEKKIKTPITITGKFEKVSPSLTLCLPDKSNKVIKRENDPMTQCMSITNPDNKSNNLITQNMLIIKSNNDSSDKLITQDMLIVKPDNDSPDKLITQNMVMVKPDNASSDKLVTQNMLMVKPENVTADKLKVLEVLDIEFDTEQSKINPASNDQNVTYTDKISKISHSPPKKSTLLKNKVNPERTAAIERKRKFNMKLKDVIESCLDKLDNPVKNSERDRSLNNSQNSNYMTKNNLTSSEDLIDKQLGAQESSCTRVKTLPNDQEYTIAYLESRMKKMENTLLSKIEQNSQSIMDLKGSQEGVQKCTKLCDKKSTSTQTNTNEHCYKKYLYQEISKYLSPTSNSIIFEELFINKFSCSEIKGPITRKRKKLI